MAAMTHGQRSAALIRAMLAEQVALDDEPEVDPFEHIDRPEREHRSSLDALCHEGGREFLPADAFSFRSRP